MSGMRPPPPPPAAGGGGGGAGTMLAGRMLHQSPPTFSDARAPEGYVVGRGRGAFGFTTSSDIIVPNAGRSETGPVHSAANDAGARFGAPPPGYVAGRGRGLGDTRREALEAQASAARAVQRQQQRVAMLGDDEDDDYGGGADDDRPLDEQEGGLFNDAVYEDDDREADAIYSAVDERMDSRGAKRRDERLQHELKAYRQQNPTIAQQFADLKQQLTTVSEQQWESIPDIGDYRVKRAKLERITPIPDSVLDSARATATSLSATDRTMPAGASSGVSTDLASIGEGRGAVLGHKLDRMSDSVSGQTVVDPKGYLTRLSSSERSSLGDATAFTSGDGALDAGDIKKRRLLLRSVTQTNPLHAPGWISAALLEADVGRLRAARQLIGEGCRYCPTDEEVWLLAARLHGPEQARHVIAAAVKRVPNSVNLWLRASELEAEVAASTSKSKDAGDDADFTRSADHDAVIRRQRKVLRLALEALPHSARLWKAAVALESPDDARKLLQRAVECVPQSVDLWLGLARLESYENARAVLNRALKALPAEPAIWVTGAKLQEAHARNESNQSELDADDNTNDDGRAAWDLDNSGEQSKAQAAISKLIERAVRTLSINASVVDREQWLREARDAEQAGYIQTCRAIVLHAAGLHVEDIDRRKLWKADAEAAERDGYIHSTRALLSMLTTTFPSRKGLWLRAARFERKQSSRERLDALLKRAVGYCPQAEALWLMAARERWQSGDIEGARAVLHEAFVANPNAEAIWLAAVRLELDAGEVDRARKLLSRARVQAPSGRVYLKSALLERDFSSNENDSAQMVLLTEGLRLFPRHVKLWLMLAQLHERNGDVNAQRSTYQRALSRRDIDSSESGKSDDAQLEDYDDQNEDVPLWLGLAALEEEQGSSMRARAVLERARQKLPMNDEVWLASMRLESRSGVGGAADQVTAKALLKLPKSGRLWSAAIEMEARPKQKGRSVEALKRCDNDARVMLAVARLFWRDRKLEKARSWFERAVALDPDLGDAWAMLWAFERAHGTEARLNEIEKRCSASDPRHGELWVRVSKALGNHNLKVLEILRKVGNDINV